MDIDFFQEFLTNEIAYVDSLHVMEVDKEICTGRGRPCDGNLDIGRRQVWAGVAATVEAAGQSTCGSSFRGRNCCLHPDISSHLLSECKRFRALGVPDCWKISRDHRLASTAWEKSTPLNGAK